LIRWAPSSIKSAGRIHALRWLAPWMGLQRGTTRQDKRGTHEQRNKTALALADTAATQNTERRQSRQKQAENTLLTVHSHFRRYADDAWPKTKQKFIHVLLNFVF
jgi:hypothetical protein